MTTIAPASGATLRPKLGSLECIRGAAALMVVFYHAQGLSTHFLGAYDFDGIFVGGRRGVDLFFVLSGFVIYHAHAKDFGAPARLGPYAYKRAARIYPNLWLVTLLLLPLFLAGFGMAGEGAAVSPYNTVASLLLLPQSASPIVAVSWTLKYEAFFYVMFAVAIFRFRFGAALFAVWQIAVLLIMLDGPSNLPTEVAPYLRPICLEFGIGIGSAMAVRALAGTPFAQSRAVLRGLLLLGILAFLACAYTDQDDISAVAGSCLMYAVASGIIVTSLVLLEGAGGFTPPRWLIALGGASYAIYLVHYSVIRMAIFVLARLHLPVWSGLDLLVLSIAGVMAGWLLYIGFDKPTQALLRRPRALTPRGSPVDPAAIRATPSIGQDLAASPGHPIA